MRTVALALFAALAMNLGCRTAQPPPPASAAARGPDSAAEIAREAVDGRVTMLVHVDRLLGFRFSRQLFQLGGWDAMVAITGIDALRDIERAFVAAHASHNGHVTIVLMHHADENKVARALAAMHEKWLTNNTRYRDQWKREAEQPSKPAAPEPPKAAPPAADPPKVQPKAQTAPEQDAARKDPAISDEDDDPMDGPTYAVRLRDLEQRISELHCGFSCGPYMPDPSRFPFPAAYMDLNNSFAHTNGPVLIAAPHPGLLVMLPTERAFAAFRLMEGGGLPAPRGREGIVFRAWDPEQSIQSGPLWSPDVRFAEAVFSFDATGNSTLRFRAICASPEAAKIQAGVMTNQVEDAQSFSIGGAKLRLFDYIEFKADKDRVNMRTHLLAEDIDWIVAMSMKPPAN